MPSSKFERAHPPNGRLIVEADVRAGADVFLCRGAFTLATYRQMDDLIAQVKASRRPKIVLDLLDVRAMDSTGVGTLAVLLKHAMTNGRDLVLVASAEVRKLLEAATLDRAFRFAETLAQALQAR